jgi:hypothetical protein
MTRQETKDIAIALKKTVQLLRIERSQKVEIYLGLVEGLAKSPFFNDEDLKDLDFLLNEAITTYKKRVRQAPKML